MPIPSIDPPPMPEPPEAGIASPFGIGCWVVGIRRCGRGEHEFWALVVIDSALVILGLLLPSLHSPRPPSAPPEDAHHGHGG